MRRDLVAALLACALASQARAQVIDATAQTLIAGRADPRDGKVYTVIPLYETVSLLAYDLRVPYVDDFRIVVRGWGLIAPWGEAGPLPSGDRYTGDLDVGFVEGRLFKKKLEVRLGRQLVFGGAARAVQMDGAQLTWNLWKGLALSIYGGAPVIPRFMTGRGDAMAGARASWRMSARSEAGLSFIHIEDKGRTLRQEFGGDLRIRAHRTLTLSAFAMLSTVEARLAEADVQARYQPLTWLEVMADWRRTAPDLFLPRGSILSVFAMETRDEAGASVFARALGRLKLEGDYHFAHDDGGWGHRGGARLTVALGPSWEGSIGAEGRVLSLPINGYWQARLFATYRVGSDVALTLDLDCYKLDKPINGDTLSFTGAATLGWSFVRHWRLVVAGIADTTPFLQQRFEVIAKLTWDQTFRLRVVR
jgi:hypothetical protein